MQHNEHWEAFKNGECRQRLTEMTRTFTEAVKEVTEVAKKTLNETPQSSTAELKPIVHSGFEYS